jgi:hypothetical protein
MPLVFLCTAGALAACNLVLGLDDLKDQIDSGAADVSVADAGDGAVETGPNCPDYCASIIKHCLLPNAQYLDPKTCLAMCARFPMGTSSQNANSLLCRLANLKVVEVDPSKADASCASAGPYAPYCGGEGENFCALYTSFCGDGGGYGTNCPNAFMNIPDPADGGDFTSTNAGGTRSCHKYYLEAAYQHGDGLFCTEASKGSSAGFCQ